MAKAPASLGWTHPSPQGKPWSVSNSFPLVMVIISETGHQLTRGSVGTKMALSELWGNCPICIHRGPENGVKKAEK